MTKQPRDKYKLTNKEAVERMNKALQRAFTMPPKPHGPKGKTKAAPPKKGR